MAYLPLNIKATQRPRQSNSSLGAVKGVNLLQAPELLDTQYCQEMDNYYIEQQGQLKKREGLAEIFSVAGTNAITMLKEYSTDLWLFAYNTTVAAYDKTTDTVTNIKTDFTTSDPFSGTKYGNYFFVCNGGDKIGRISRTITYGSQTTNFVVGEVVTGGTSGATGVILEDVDAGATGTLTLGNITGTFQNGEALSAPGGGNGTTTSTLGFTYTEITDAPKAKVIFAFGARLYAGNIEGNSSKVVWSAIDDGTNPPFTDFTPSASPALADDAGSLEFRNAGALKAFSSLGSQVIALFEDGKTGFRIDTIDVSGVGLSQYTQVDFQRIDFGGERGALNTPEGIFYVNESGVWQMASGGSTNQPFSEQESNISRVFGQDFTDALDFTDSDIVFDTKRNLVLVSCKEGSDFNNKILWYNINSKNFGTFSGIQLARFLKIGSTIYAGSSVETKVFEVFKGSDDDGADIKTSFIQEVNLGGLDQLNALVNTSIKGFVSSGADINISFDIYDKNGILIPDYKSYTLSSEGSSGDAKGFNEFSFGDGFGNGLDNANLIETRGKKRTRIREFTRIIMKVSSTDSLPHEITWISLDTAIKGENRTKRNLN